MSTDLETLLRNTLTNTSIAAFGMSMPVLSPVWTKNANTIGPELVQPIEERMAIALSDTLSPADNGWLCPIAGYIRTFTDDSMLAHMPAALIGADGTPVPAAGEQALLLTVFEQTYLRLSRLYRKIFEPSFSPPEGDDGTLTLRPVPRYFLFVGEPAAGSGLRSGNAAPGDDLGWFGRMTVHDRNGHIMDPMAVAAAFQALMVRHEPLQQREITAAFSADTQLKRLLDRYAASPAVRIRISDHAGRPYDSGVSRLTGLSAVQENIGLYSLNSASGTGSSDLTGTVGMAPGTGTAGTFPDEERRTFLFGAATTGRLTGTFTPVPLPGGTMLARDFFSLRAFDAKPYLVGMPPDGQDSFLGTRLEPRPIVRMFESVQLLADGNDVLGAASSVLSGSPPTESLAVAQWIDGSFRVPAAAGAADAHWPGFPPVPSGETAAPAGVLPANLRDAITVTANFVTSADGSVIDVLVTIGGLPAHASVKAYPRKFISDAREARGAGTGGTAQADGILTLLLSDPFSFRTVQNLASPVIGDTGTTSAKLRFDLIVVKRTGESRMYGNLVADVGEAIPLPALSAGTNPFNNARRKSVCKAGILSLGLLPLAAATPSAPSGDEFLRTVRALTGEPASGAEAREAPRLPTMSRRDLLVAGLDSGTWRAVLAGGRLAPDMHGADSRRGSPGGLGGRETQVTGVSTQGGRLAYDVARMAFRRTTNIVERMTALAGSAWNEPAAASPPEAADTGTAARTFCAAVLQTVAPYCETPEFHLFKHFVEQNPDDIPETFDQLIDWLKDKVMEAESAAADMLNSLDLSNDTLTEQLDSLRDRILAELESLKDNSPTAESRNERLFNELRREVTAAIYGRRDAQWAIDNAIGSAQRFIYIETPGFASTQKDYGTAGVPPYARDLLAKIQARLNEMPGLHVMICTPRRPDYGIGYEAYAAQEVEERRTKILALPDKRVVSFHPVGFPGLQSNLETMTVIVDDVWAMVGSSSFRRRGLTFDGGSDMVFTDVNLVDGRSPAIVGFRRQLMSARLGIPDSDTGVLGAATRHPGFIRLNDGVDAFHVIREMLVAGGLGKIERLWNGRLSGVPPLQKPLPSSDFVNPDGMEFDIVGLWTQAFIASLSTSEVRFL